MCKGLFVGVVGLLAIAQSGCSSGDSDPPVPQPTRADGIWEGSASSAAGTMEFSGVVTEAGEGRFVDGFGTQYLISSIEGVEGDVTIRFTAMTRPGLSFTDGSTVTTGSFTGTIARRATVDGSYTLSSGETGTISMAYNPIYERDSSLDKLTGPWDEQLGIQVFDPDGSFFEQDGFGCIYQGQAFILDPDYNVYGLTMMISLCGAADGEYEGVGVLADFQATEDLFLVLLNNEQAVVSTSMLRL